ncbi:tetratricopeptide repeat domain protein [Verrucomicrobiia bacterium DG1235]|nr:tetratricopeptide repeat domain protein [Verrucomicrobiae bacterium DG1235]
MACLILLCVFVAFSGFYARSALPPRPDLASFSPILSERLSKAERCLFYPWSNRASCWFELGQLYHANRFYAEAEVCYLESISRSDEDAAVAHYLLADIAKQEGDLAAAKRSLAKSIALAPDSLPALLDYAEVTAKSGDVQAASALYNRVLKKNVDNPKALLELARFEMLQNRPEEALPLLLRIAKRDPNYIDGITLLTQVLDTLGEREKASMIRSEISRRKPAPTPNPWMEALLEHCFDSQRLSFIFEDYLKAGQLEKAFVYLDRMEEIDPTDSNPHMLRGYAYYQVKRYGQAVPHYRKAIALGGDTASLYYYLTTCLSESGQVEEAERMAREGLERAPQTVDLMVVLSDIVLKRGLRDEGVELLQQALALAPAHISANRTLAKLYWEEGKKEAALDQLEMLRTLQPTDFATRMTLGNYYLEKGDFEAAIAVVEEARRIDPENTDIRNLLALSLMRQGNEEAREGAFEKAVAVYSRAIEADASLEEAYLNKVKVLMHIKRFADAEGVVRALMERRPEDPVLSVSLGDIQLAAGNASGARATWETGLELAKGNRELRTVIESRIQSVVE